MRAFSVVLFSVTSFAACARHGTALDASQVSTAPPPGGCTLVGRASGSATEQTESAAIARARQNLAADGERLAGTYVQITGQDVTPVEMAINVVEVRLEGRVFRCAEADREAGAVGPAAVAAIAAADATCAAPAERRELDASEGPGWQCARRAGDNWIADGPYVVYWPGGATKVEGAFQNGKRSGRWSSYYSNGQVRDRATYRDGQLQGCAERFDAEGNARLTSCAGTDAGGGTDRDGGV
jgi:hypothetical protein